MQIVDENFNFLPIRKVGLICTRGAHVMLGYLNQPDKARWLHSTVLVMTCECADKASAEERMADHRRLWFP